MNSTMTVTPRSNHRQDLIRTDTNHSLVVPSKEKIQDLVRESLMPIHEVLAELRDMTAKTEAEIEAAEKISVVIEKERTVLSIERTFRFAKDR